MHTFTNRWRRAAYRLNDSARVASALGLLSFACSTQPAKEFGPEGGGSSSLSTSGASSANAGAPGAGTPGVAGAAGSSTAGGASGASAMTPDASPDAAPPEPPDSGSEPSDAAVPNDAGAQSLPKRVLLYHFSTLDIASLPAQLTFFKQQLASWNYEVDDSVDPSLLTDQSLQRYAAVAMINTCFEPFGKGKPDQPQSQVLQRFLQRGGGLFGTHCASVTFQSASPPVLYNQLIGGRGGDGSFDGTSSCRVLSAHPSTATLAASFSFSGNLDNTDFLATDSVVLVKCQWQGGAAKDVNVSWFRNEGLGRVFYTNFGKVAADLTNATLGPHISGGLAWVLRIPG